MNARIIDGTALAREVRADVARRALALAQLGIKPGLAVILVGDDAASQVYVRNKIKACVEAGLHSVFEKFDTTLTQADLLARVKALNDDPGVHGILVQMPLPRHIDSHEVIATIATHKDVDGFSVLSAGELASGLPGLRPCTPYGCMKLIESTGISLRGKHAVVIGRSNTVGKPMAMMLLQADATVTICHSATPDLGLHTRQADVLVAAVGRRNTVTAEMVKPGAVVIDVGSLVRRSPHVHPRNTRRPIRPPDGLGPSQIVPSDASCTAGERSGRHEGAPTPWRGRCGI